MTSLNDYMSSDTCGNAPWVDQSSLIGSHRSAYISISDNPPGYYPDPPIDEFTLTLTTKGVGHAQIDVGAGVLHDDICAANTLLFVAADVKATYDVSFLFSLKCIGLPKSLMAQAMGKSISELDFEDLHKTYMRDPLLEALVKQLGTEAEGGNPNGALYLDHLLYMTAAQVAANTRQMPERPEKPHNLSSAQISTIVQKMEDDLEERLTLEALAALVDMSVFQFARAFRATMGETPYRYLLLRRIARAEALIRQQHMNLAEIAYACGFASQAHMTSVFSKNVGYSPGSLRRMHAG